MVKQMVGIKLSFPLFAAMANNRGAEPGPRPSTERPATYRVSLSELLNCIYTCIMAFALIKKCLHYPACICRHEDGTVRFWDASGVCLYPMYKLSTAGVFHTDADPNDNMNSSSEGEWPPFRKVCVFITPSVITVITVA